MFKPPKIFVFNFFKKSKFNSYFDKISFYRKRKFLSPEKRINFYKYEISENIKSVIETPPKYLIFDKTFD